MHDDLIMDIGVHKGEDAEFYLKKGFRVVGVEANPELYGIVKDRLKSYIDLGQLILLNVAIATVDGSITFFKNLDVSAWGTISKVG